MIQLWSRNWTLSPVIEICFKAGQIWITWIVITPKTKFVIFEKRSVKPPNIVIGEREIYFCDSYKYLGIHIDKKLNFDEHINYVTAELAQHSGILYKLITTLNDKHCINIYKLIQCIPLFISPLVQVGVLLYGLGPIKIFVFRKRSIRIALRLATRTSVTEKI